MDKLLNVHREGGYPLVGENLKIIEDWPRYIEATLNGLMIPSLTCVILDTGTSGVLNPPSIICYIASDSIADRGLYDCISARAKCQHSSIGQWRYTERYIN